MSDIVERLRTAETDPAVWDFNPQRLEKLCEEAAAAIEQRDAEIARLRAGQEGWKLVPVEPTEAMLQAACESTLLRPLTHEGAHRAGYISMLGAAPTPPATAPAGEEG